MNRRATLSNGNTYVIDDAARTITNPDDADDLVALIASNLMLTDDLIGPQVDDMVGVRGTWDDPRAPLVALVAAARRTRVAVLNVEPE